jgi:hypothetical protein
VVADSAWNVDGFGNHRAVVAAKKSGHDAVLAELPWRRPDLRPETKKIIVVDAATGHEIKDVAIIDLSNERGTVAFRPETLPGIYYIYYLPYKFRASHGDARYGKPLNDYLVPEYEADAAWKKSVEENAASLPRAAVERFESRQEFDFFTPMGLIATDKEVRALQEKHPGDFVVFPEDRAYPIRLQGIPARWASTGEARDFEGFALRNEYYTWQIGVWASQKDLKHIKLIFSDLTNGSDVIKATEITCFNEGGTNWDGQPIAFDVNVAKGNVQALWCGLQIPENAKTGSYKGKVRIEAEGSDAKEIGISIHVGKEVLADHGDGDLWRHSRLRWLNSTIGGDDMPVEPFEKMTLEGKKITATEKTLIIDDNGLPQNIEINGLEVLAKPLSFEVVTTKGAVGFKADNLKISQKADGRVEWTASSVQDGLKFDCFTYMEFDGYLRYRISLSADNEMIVNDIRLLATYTPAASEYFMGAGFKGGYRPTAFSWDWKGPWDSYWIGGYKAGLHTEFRGGTYHGPLINDYKPAPPKSWANDGKGRINVTGGLHREATVRASTGSNIVSSEPIEFEFALLITPVKPLNTAKQFGQRYYHSLHENFDKAAEEDGVNIANIHHAQTLNPVINYPFIVRDSLINFIKREHLANRKVKLYYTIRELTTWAKEVYALKSLNHEIFVAGPGQGLPWYNEHLIDDYKPAWYTELPGQNNDAALVLNGFSRWINYYLEGLRWMFENYEIDGIYMDDVSFDRDVMKRIRKIIAKYRPGSLIDLHSNTGYSIGPANQYTGFFAYVDRLWFGESFRYNQMTPDEWFVTFSGIPFGVMSEMLQDGGNRWLGMVYGATARHSWSYGNEFSPVPVWKIWYSFGIADAEMLGYWDENCPVKTDNPNVKATAYVRPDKTLISIGNFDAKDISVRLTIDWKRLGLDPAKVKIHAPQILNFQDGRILALNASIPVKGKQGYLLILSNK